jgi:hypothetical protein
MSRRSRSRHTSAVRVEHNEVLFVGEVVHTMAWGQHVWAIDKVTGLFDRGKLVPPLGDRTSEEFISTALLAQLSTDIVPAIS